MMVKLLEKISICTAFFKLFLFNVFRKCDTCCVRGCVHCMLCVCWVRQASLGANSVNKNMLYDCGNKNSRAGCEVLKY